MKRTIVLLCNCGRLMSGKLDFEELKSQLSREPEVAEVREHDSLCLPNGLTFATGAIREGRFDRVVVAACADSITEQALKEAAQAAGVPPSCLEVIGMREECASVHGDRKQATEKAASMLRGAIARASRASWRPVQKISVAKAALVIGGGIAGTQCAIDIANAGHKVYLVERDPSIGGMMAQLDKTFPTMDCSICMPGEEEVILGDGTTIGIGELAEALLDEQKGKFEVHSPRTYSYDDHRLLLSPIVRAQKLRAPSRLLEVQTSTGMKLRFTPDHEILVDRDTGPSWVRCSELKVGDRLYSPRKLDVKPNWDTWILDLLPEHFKVPAEELHTETDATPAQDAPLRSYSGPGGSQVLLQRERWLSIGDIKNRCEDSALRWETLRRGIRRIRYRGVHGSILLGSQILDKRMMYLLGLIASDGNVEEDRIRFYNTERSLVRRFIRVYNDLFPGRSACISHVRPDNEAQRERMVVQVKNKVLFSIATELDVKRGLKPLLRLDENLIAAFLRGYFDGDGHVAIKRGKGWVTAKVTLALGDEYERGYRLHLLLKRLGIISKVLKYKRRVIVDISERRDVLAFANRVGSDHPRKAPVLRRVAEIGTRPKIRGGMFEELPLEVGLLLSRLRRRYCIKQREYHLSHSNLLRALRQECRTTRENLGRILETMDRRVDSHDEDYLRLQKILDSPFFLDKVTRVKSVAPKDGFVYDVTVRDTHCFLPKGAFVVSNCIEGPKLSEAGRNKNITIVPNATVKSVSGRMGDFRVQVEIKPTYVDPTKCNGCGACIDVCPVYQPNKYDVDLKPIRAIYSPFAQAVPLKYVINKDICIECGMCMKACGLSAINLNDVPKNIELNVGAIVVATGAVPFDARRKPQYGYGEIDDVITNMEFERVICASGPTGGLMLTKKGEHAKKVAFIQCVGSRDEEGCGIEECSFYCCAGSMKEARLIVEHDPEAKVYIFYTDLRAFGKGWEGLYTRCREDGIVFIRSRPSEIRKNDETGRPVVVYEDTLSGRKAELEVDTAVLAVGIHPDEGTKELASILKIPTDKTGFLEEAHQKMRPLESIVDGIFLAGTCHGPRDIVESVVEGTGAASLAVNVLSRDELELPVVVAKVNTDKCTGCMKCEATCLYGAIARQEGKAHVDEGICKGCGACASACYQGAITLENWGRDQMLRQVSAVVR